MRALLIALLAFAFVAPAPAADPPRPILVGVAREDITPDYPVRLSGYGNRRTESEGVEQHIFAKALAIGSDGDGPAVVVTVDNCGVSAAIREEVLRRVAAKSKLVSERFAICSSHTHSAPMLRGVLPNLFSTNIPPEHLERIDRYTRELTDRLEKVVLAALADRQPALLAWGVGSAAFGKNRRPQPNGPTDHEVPILRVTLPDGTLRAVFANYACHCTTVTGEFNRICGDWAGYAQEFFELEHPGATALIALGCGADQNPFPRPGFPLAQQHGREIAVELKRLLATPLKPIHGTPSCRTKRLELPFDTLPTREEWEAKAKQAGGVGYHARLNLARLDRGEKLQTRLPYLVQTWTFGDDLALVFLPGEVVVDYSLRIKKEFDSARVWVNGYANDVPCYIPSRRILKEGGYEGGGAMVYYDRPTRFADAVEDLIIGAVHDLMPKTFLAARGKSEMLPPKSPRDSLASIRVPRGYKVELVAAEPLIVDPVAIDFGADGKLWVVEMRDYPTGMDGNWKPGGRVKFLEDTDGDGRFDKATAFLDGLPFPTGVTAWRKGALICAAPDIIYAEDSDGDGRADLVRKVFSGFETNNYQARVNSLTWGLDNWVHGANGLLGGVINGIAGGKVVDIRGRDFRMNPDSGVFEPVAGLTQQGRVRDDWGNWFGCDNSTPFWHFPLPDQYARRNPHVALPAPRLRIAAGAEPNLIFPASATLNRFNHPESANHVTSGCGLGIYRDELLGKEAYGNAFVCEPVHNLVTRRQLVPRGLTFDAVRAPDERQSEFLASTDNWFRPVQVTTGPDGALYVVDMYRFVVEHPRWIPPDRLALLDVRAGDDKGRIYRVLPEGKAPRPVPKISRLTSEELLLAFDTPNGMLRDLAHREFVLRGVRTAVGSIEEVVFRASDAAVRLQALCVLDGLKALRPAVLQQAGLDQSPSVRAHALRLSEPWLAQKVSLAAMAIRAADDPDITVRFQAALSLGECKDLEASTALARALIRDLGDPWMRAAVLSSALHHPVAILQQLLRAGSDVPGRGDAVGQLLTTALATGGRDVHGELLGVVAPVSGHVPETWQLAALAGLHDGFSRQHVSFGTFASSSESKTRDAAARILAVFKEAPALAANLALDEERRVAAVGLLGRGFLPSAEDLRVLAGFLGPQTGPRLRQAALDRLRQLRDPEVAGLLLKDWSHQAPSMRTAALDVLLGREDWILALLGGIERGEVSPGDIPLANRPRLISHKNPRIKSLAERIFATGSNTDRAQVIARYSQTGALTGDALKGKDVFTRNCASCHLVGGVGFAVGPDLAIYRTKNVQDFLAGILDPNAVIEPRFTAYTVDTRDERSLSGVITGETSTSVTLMQGGGIKETILHSDIRQIRASPISLMPEGLEQVITPQEMADLIAFLRQGA